MKTFLAGVGAVALLLGAFLGGAFAGERGFTFSVGKHISSQIDLKATMISMNTLDNASFGVYFPLSQEMSPVFPSLKDCIGQTAYLGSFPPDTEPTFYLKPAAQASALLSTDSSHCLILRIDPDTWESRWEVDGDDDYDDFVIRIRQY